MGIESPTHLIFIAIIALIVLGPKRLPELARSLGHGIREFRQSLEDGANSHDAPQQTVAPSASASSPTPTPPPPPAPVDTTAPVDTPVDTTAPGAPPPPAAPPPAAAPPGAQPPQS
jgi:sec-independent protein translocase protein TatA